MQYGNLPPKYQGEKTTSYYDTFFKNGLNTSSNVNDAFIGYFQSVTGDRDSGITLAGSVLYVALSTGVQPMTLLDEFRKLEPGELNSYMATVLNINRKGTSLLGITNTPKPNQYITRAILP